MIAKIKSQQTLKKQVKLKGVGLHTGEQILMVLNPAPENKGIQFVRTDLDPQVEIPALANFVTLTDRGTTIEKEGVKIQKMFCSLDFNSFLFNSGASICKGNKISKGRNFNLGVEISSNKLYSFVFRSWI
jgi:hypothetical protein